MNASEAQKSLERLFSNIFGESNVITEWPSSRNAGDWLRRFGQDIIYAPRPDIAIGPYNISEGRNAAGIVSLFNQNRSFFNRLGTVRSHESLNENPRCLIAIEIENSGSSKHMIGNIINASLLGKVGIIVTLRDEFYRKAKRTHKYLVGAFERKKIGYNPSNVVIKRYNELERYLLEYYRRVKNKFEKVKSV
jgi:hypothetical protein